MDDVLKVSFRSSRVLLKRVSCWRTLLGLHAEGGLKQGRIMQHRLSKTKQKKRRRECRIKCSSTSQDGDT